MTAGGKCPKCGLVQMPRATCKACGTSLTSQTPHDSPTQPVPEERMAATDYLSWLRQHQKLLVLGGVILLVLVGIYGFRTMSNRAEEWRAANEVLQTLQGLKSVTTAGLTYREYSPRALDAKIEIDRYLQTEGGNARIKKSVAEAMALYIFAGSVWNARIVNSADGYEAIVQNPSIDLCPYTKLLRDELIAKGNDNYWVGKGLGKSTSWVWNCASAKIAKIERLLNN